MIVPLVIHSSFSLCHYVSFYYSGSAMNVAYGPEELLRYLSDASRVSQVSDV
jgi:hypothetical protein